jgi:hypothetical protein
MQPPESDSTALHAEAPESKTCAPVHPGRRGRPPKVGPLDLSEIETLRSAGKHWKEIGLELGLKPETCRRALWAVKKSQKGVGNSPERPLGPFPEP